MAHLQAVTQSNTAKMCEIQKNTASTSVYPILPYYIIKRKRATVCWAEFWLRSTEYHWICAPCKGIKVKKELTLNFNSSGGLNDPQSTGSNAGIVSGLLNIGQLEHILPDRYLVFRREVRRRSFPPLDQRHGRAHRHARQVQAITQHHLVDWRRRDRELRRDTAHWKNPIVKIVTNTECRIQK